MIELSCLNDKGKKVSTLKPLKVTGHYQQLCKVVLEERVLSEKKIGEACFTQFYLGSLFFIQVKSFQFQSHKKSAPHCG